MIAYHRQAGVLIEFSLIALILFFLLAGIFEFGRATFSANVLQQAADVIAQELSRIPLPSEIRFNLDDPEVKQSIAGVYSEDFLAIDITDWASGGQSQTLLDYLQMLNLPIGNRLLVPLMIVLDGSQNPQIPAGKTFLVYPGALVPSPTAASGFTVRIPVVTYPAEGVEQIAPESQWLRVVEPIRDAEGNDLFSITSSARGLAAIRVNFPFQAASLSGTNAGPGGPSSPEKAYIRVSPGEELQSGQAGGPYSGPTGLGQQVAFATTVRPFRRILSAQGVYRREIFQTTSPAQQP